MAGVEDFFPNLRATVAGWGPDLRAAGAFLTVLPVPMPVGARGRKVAKPPASAVRAFPVIGAGVGIIAGAALMVGRDLSIHPMAGALIALAVAAALTGALHEDGLADTADGLGGGQTAAARLKVMQDSRIGSFGVLAIVFSVAIRAAFLAGMATPGVAVLALIAAGAASRGAMSAVMVAIPTARHQGLAATFGRPAREDAVTGALLGGALALLCLGPLAGILAVALSAATAFAVAGLAKRHLGGYTGDVLGAVQQACEIAVLLAVVVIG
ncbi:MAG: adenosylcobinamide-GDP ribazoletransferase [Rhodospirillales bacterium]|jgi:adenosylcobinamide-GDP ribazoletransferase|nr:adenosylcobinamide-GDP ribazoletransferase [Rhodospirillales bacterium]MDP6805324.1 adenosylcobinamide-GDP ribazoletransferase [Rhodospirillales bacterium]